MATDEKRMGKRFSSYESRGCGSEWMVDGVVVGKVMGNCWRVW